jgi:hypothetical protein
MSGGAGGASGGGFSSVPSVRQQNNQMKQFQKGADQGLYPQNQANQMADEYMQSIATAGQPTDLGLEQARRMDQPPLSPRKWVSLDPTIVLRRIDELATDPNKINQGVLGLCGPAVFYRHIAKLNPAGFSTFAKALYREAEAFLGNFRVAPSQSLLNADYAALVEKWPHMPPQADWMLLAALRDSRNWYLSFYATQDDDESMRTDYDEVSRWYADCGFYSSVSLNGDRTPAAIQAIAKAKAPNNHIALAIDAKLIGNSPGGHMIALEGPIIIDPAADTASFQYWSYGQPIMPRNTTWTDLQKYYRASIVATLRDGTFIPSSDRGSGGGLPSGPTPELSGPLVQGSS